jgi:hypothetical protein
MPPPDGRSRARPAAPFAGQGHGCELGLGGLDWDKWMRWRAYVWGGVRGHHLLTKV